MSTSSIDSDNASRKRVCKACDRCRLKKSKCDGSTPCTRCRSDNAICVFGERKKSHDKVYPKGYVEMLEQQQLQLVNGLQELYKRSVSGRTWTGPVLQDPGNGRPLTHDILETLGVLKQRTRSKLGSFEEDLDVMQRKLVTGGASFEHHRGSPDTEPDTSPIQVSPIQMSFLESIPQKQMFTDPFNSSQMPTPPLESPQRRLSHEDAQIHSGAASYTGPQRLTSMNPGMIQHRQSWVPCPAVYSDGMDFEPFDTSLDFANIKSEQQLRPVSISEASSGLAFPDWSEDDFGKFLNPTLT